MIRCVGCSTVMVGCPLRTSPTVILSAAKDLIREWFERRTEDPSVATLPQDDNWGENTRAAACRNDLGRGGGGRGPNLRRHPAGGRHRGPRPAPAAGDRRDH